LAKVSSREESAPVKAFIYAAGRGSRLGPEHSVRPKILLKLGGRSLLEWHVRQLRAIRIAGIHVVVGYKAEEVHAEMRRLEAQYGVPVQPILNPDYTEGSVLSVAVSLPRLQAEHEPVLIMDGDVLYGRDMLPRLVGSAHRTALLIDRSYSVADDDPVLVPVRDGRPFEFRKQWSGACDLAGESIGFFKVDRADLPALVEATLRRTTGAGRRESYDEVLRDLVLQGRFGYEDVTGMPWVEVDFPADIEFANQKVLPCLELS
jgi:choline kinase